MNSLRLTAIICIGAFSIAKGSLADEDDAYQIHQQAVISSAAGTPWNAARQIEMEGKAVALQPHKRKMTRQCF